MIPYLKSENLKLKHTFTKKLIFIAPITALFFAFMSGTYFQQNAFNWWYVIILQGSIALICAMVNGKEENKMKYRAVFPLPIDLKKVWFSKIGIIAIYTLLSSVVLSLGVIGGKYILCHMFKLIYMSPSTAVLAGIVITITSLWQIPMCLFLAKKFGFFTPVFLNVAMSMPAELGSKSLWWLWPYGWTTRLMCPILGIRPNGELVDAKYLLNSNVIPVGIGLSIVMFVILLLATANWFKKQEVL